MLFMLKPKFAARVHCRGLAYLFDKSRVKPEVAEKHRLLRGLVVAVHADAHVSCKLDLEVIEVEVLLPSLHLKNTLVCLEVVIHMLLLLHFKVKQQLPALAALVHRTCVDCETSEQQPVGPVAAMLHNLLYVVHVSALAGFSDCIGHCSFLVDSRLGKPIHGLVSRCREAAVQQPRAHEHAGAADAGLAVYCKYITGVLLHEEGQLLDERNQLIHRRGVP